MSVTPYAPNGVPMLGRTAVLYLPTIADPKAAKLSEVTGTGVINLSCVIRAFAPTRTQAKIKKYVLCSRQGREVLGRTEIEIADLMLLDDPQADSTDDGWKHKALDEDVTGWLLERRGLDADPANFAAFAVGQKYRAYPIRFGADNLNAPNPEEDGQEYERMLPVSVIGEMVKGAIAA